VISGFSTTDIFETIEPRKIGETLKADAIITGKVTEFESLYAGVYSSVSVGAELKMFDKVTGEVLWSLTHKETSRSGNVPVSIVGAILGAATTALDLTKYNFVATANHFCQLAVDTIPSSKAHKGKTLPRILTMAHDGMNRLLKEGDRLQVGVEGATGLSADFIISPGNTPYHMEEKVPGSYIGSYVIREGDAVKDGVIVVKLYDTWGNTSTWEDTLGFVNVDGNTPPSITGLRITPGDHLVRLKWNPCDAKDVVKYHVWKSETPLSGYSKIGQTEFTSFEDSDVVNNKSYFYRITASDKAGNMGQALPGISVTPVPPGPTVVTGTIEKANAWFPGANPYI
ncbi:MAG: DUF799 family lipoprotein, partial [Desulfobacterales bacterium]|nr:DUF799 family lipoprotein [Desulfobacterales bacterium]